MMTDQRPGPALNILNTLELCLIWGGNLSQTIKYIGLQTEEWIRLRNSGHSNPIRSARCTSIWNKLVLKSAPYNMQLRHRWERRGIALKIHTLRAEGGWRSTPRPGQSTPGKTPSTQLHRRLGGSWCRCGQVQKIWPAAEFEHRWGRLFWCSSIASITIA
jgi:hypothetical protein